MIPPPYTTEIEGVLPRLLGLYDTDPLSATHGLGDRSYWARKTIDFPNATYQGAINGLAQLVALGTLPEWLSEERLLQRIEAMVGGIDFIRKRGGGLGEAYPHEASFCVTALVLFDALVALDLLGARVDAAGRKRWLAVLAPLASLVERGDESHAFISNHLATAAAALFRWHHAVGEGEKRGRVLLGRILKAQSSEGWFPEYGGADPGYQTLCLHYLSDLYHLRPDLDLRAPLERAVRFLTYFAHPDGSFGGLYGSRGTRFLVPSAFEALAAEMPEAAALAAFARKSLARRAVIPLSAFDEPNLPVMFNAWARAATFAAASGHVASEATLPCCGLGRWRTSFDEAGILVDKGEAHYTIIGWRRGGVVHHYLDNESRIDPGVAATNKAGAVATTQGMNNRATIADDGDGVITVTADLATSQSAPPTPFQFAIVRLLAVTVLRFETVNELFKWLVVKRVITGSRGIGLTNRRRIRLGRDLTIEDAWIGEAGGWVPAKTSRPFHFVHMASRGYWQRDDDA